MYSGYSTDANMRISFSLLFGDAFRISAGSILEKALGIIIHNSATVTLKIRHTTIPSKIVLDQTTFLPPSTAVSDFFRPPFRIADQQFLVLHLVAADVRVLEVLPVAPYSSPIFTA